MENGGEIALSELLESGAPPSDISPKCPAIPCCEQEVASSAPTSPA